MRDQLSITTWLALGAFLQSLAFLLVGRIALRGDGLGLDGRRRGQHDEVVSPALAGEGDGRRQESQARPLALVLGRDADRLGFRECLGAR